MSYFLELTFKIKSNLERKSINKICSIYCLPAHVLSYTFRLGI